MFSPKTHGLMFCIGFVRDVTVRENSLLCYIIMKLLKWLTFSKDSSLNFGTFMYEEEKYYFKKRNFLNFVLHKGSILECRPKVFYYCQIESRTDA